MANSLVFTDAGEAGTSEVLDLSLSTEEDDTVPVEALSDGDESYSSGIVDIHVHMPFW